jgi:hypothetical protein
MKSFEITILSETRKFEIRPGVGPQGPQGEQGIQGETGPAGPAGPAAEWSNLTGLIDIAPFDTSNGGPTATGELAWMAATETLALRLKNGENLDLGEETIYHVDNNTGSTIAKGAAVAYAGTVGGSGKIRVKLWNGSTDAPEAFMGLAMGDIPTGDDGYVTAFGVVRGVNTSAFSDGVILYASPSGTGLTATKPAGVHVIACLCINAGNNGTLLVRPTVSGFSADNHTHGNITNAGAIGTTADLVAVTGTGGVLTVASRSGIDSRTSFPNADVTAATADAVTGTLVRRSPDGTVEFATVSDTAISASAGDDGFAIAASATSGKGISAAATSGLAISAVSASGTNHAEFGESANNRSFIRRVLGLIGWHRGSFTQTFGSGATLTANRAVTLPDADGEATLNAATQTLTNKTISGANNTISNIAISTAVSGLGTGVATALAVNANATGGFVTIDGTATLTNKTLTNPTVTDFVETLFSIGNSGTAVTLNLANGTTQTVTLTGNCTFTMPTATAGKSFLLHVNSGAGGFTGTFTGVKWAGNVAPVITATASRRDIISFTADGTNWYGSIIQNFTP